MSEPAVLNHEKHGKLRFNELKDFTRFKSQHLVPVVFQEFYGMATEFPLVFVRNSESGDFVPVALMGLIKGKNLYCQTPDWQPAYVPTSFTLMPFSVKRLDESGKEAVIAIDEDSNLLSESEGQPLFEANGERTGFLKKRIEHVITITRQSLQARSVCQYLADKRLLVTRPFKLQYSPTSPRYELEGVYLIDEEALEKLPDEDFLELRRRGILPLIFSHLTSLQQIRRLNKFQDQADRSGRADSSDSKVFE